MRLSVVVPACNERNELAACLDALRDETRDIETIVVNGPSTDGTSGMVRTRDDIDVLLDCASRNLNVARNVGLREASGPLFALLAPAYRVQPGWYEAIVESLTGRAGLVTGPVEFDDEKTTPRAAVQSDRLRVNGGNLALTQEAVRALDGFDEYLITEGAKDLGQRIAGQDLHVTWHPDMTVRRTDPVDPRRRRQHRGGYGNAWQGLDATDWGSVYRSMAYRTAKNNGIGIRVVTRVVGAALRDGVAAAKGVLRGRGTPTAWVSNGVTVVRNAIRGGIDGYRARRADRTPARNPSGLSRPETEVVVDRYEEQ